MCLSKKLLAFIIQKVRKTKRNIKSNFVGVYVCTDALPIYADKNMPHEQVFFYLF